MMQPKGGAKIKALIQWTPPTSELHTSSSPSMQKQSLRKVVKREYEMYCLAVQENCTEKVS